MALRPTILPLLAALSLGASACVGDARPADTDLVLLSRLYDERSDRGSLRLPQTFPVGTLVTGAAKAVLRHPGPTPTHSPRPHAQP